MQDMSAIPQYAGFWRRFLAYLIDTIIVSTVEFLLFLPPLIFFGVGIFGAALDADAESIVGLIFLAIGAYIFLILLAMILSWLYYALMESSSRGATIGKMAVGIRVTDLAGGRITFARATGRFFAKIISGMILMIGYIMAGFTERKQALHDLLASTLVVKD